MVRKDRYKIKRTKDLSNEQLRQINQLWNQEYPVKLKDRFGLLLEGVRNYHHYLIEDEDQKLLAWAVDFEKDDEIRFSIIVDRESQAKGLGKLLVKALNENLGEYYGWVIDHQHDIKQSGEHYRSPLLFYLNQGFELLADQRIDNEILSAVKIKRRIS